LLDVLPVTLVDKWGSATCVLGVTGPWPNRL
jgi:hypothetical protein